MFLSALLACLVMYRGNTSHPRIFTVFGLTLSVCVTLALDQRTVGRVLPVVYVWRKDCRLSTGIFGIAAIKYQLSEYFHKALHTGQDGDTLRRHDKMKKIAFFFFSFFFFCPN